MREYIGWRRYTSQTEDIYTSCDSTYIIQEKVEHMYEW